MQEQHEKHDEIVKVLLKSVNNEQLNSDEQQLLDSWIEESPHNKKVYEDVSNAPLLEKEVKALAGYDQKLLWKQIERGIHGNSRKGRLIYFFRTITGRVAAAVALLLLCTGAYFAFKKSSATGELASEKKISTKTKPADLKPGIEGAILQLADGSSIVLDNAANGVLTSNIVKEDGQIIYNYLKSETTGSELSYNTMSTPRGRQYKAVLSDGSGVWLNAASSIKYPDVFKGNERRVVLTGQAYFEVAKDAKKPFKVEVNGMEIEVLGTHFEINSYEDEGIKKVTLLEGLVKVKSNGNESFLKPGQQAQLKENGNLEVIDNADVDKIMAWKDNSFYFQDDNIETIMRQISRWYDVEVVYEGKVTKKYTGIISRTKPVSAIFHVLELSGGVHFTLAGDGERARIIVKP